MSYCRWSSDDFQCDLYCYEHVDGGWTTHIAGNRVKGDIPKADYLFHEGKIAEYLGARKLQGEWLDSCEREPIGLPFDGETFSDPTLEAFRDRLISLREVGYRFPAYVLEQVEEEIAERDADEQTGGAS